MFGTVAAQLFAAHVLSSHPKNKNKNKNNRDNIIVTIFGGVNPKFGKSEAGNFADPAKLNSGPRRKLPYRPDLLIRPKTLFLIILKILKFGVVFLL